jgi:hypothetical protein
MVLLGNAFDYTLSLGLVRGDIDQEEVRNGGKIACANQHQETAEQRALRYRQAP